MTVSTSIGRSVRRSITSAVDALSASCVRRREAVVHALHRADERHVAALAHDLRAAERDARRR